MAEVTPTGDLRLTNHAQTASGIASFRSRPGFRIGKTLWFWKGALRLRRRHHVSAFVSYESKLLSCPRLATPLDPGTARLCNRSAIARPTGASPSPEALLSEMSEKPTCPNTGLTEPECCCTRCVEALLRRHPPELLDEGSLDVDDRSESAAETNAEPSK